MAKYVMRNGKFVCKKTGIPMLNQVDKHKFEKMLKEQRAPLITTDIPDYISPATGKLVSGRVARREDLKRSDCYEVDPPSKPLRERFKRKEIAPKLKESRELNEKLDAIANRAGLR